MRKRWKYDKVLTSACSTAIVLAFVGTVLGVISCRDKQEHKHIGNPISTAIDKPERLPEQTVVSDIATVSPVQQTRTPVIRATGSVAYDPRTVGTISVRFGGRIEKMYLHYNFQSVENNQRIMDIYSPDILAEQQNLIYILNSSSDDRQLVRASEQKLKLLGVTAMQIRHIERTRHPITPLPVYSTYSGHIHDVGIVEGVGNILPTGTDAMSSMGSDATTSSRTQTENLLPSQTSELRIKEGMYVQSGQPLFAVYNTSRIWVILNILPKDVALIKTGNQVSLIFETNQGESIHAVVNYVEPVTDRNSTVIKARVYLQNNPKLRLKAGALVNASITALPQSGLWIPKSSVIDLGRKKIVFVRAGSGFTARTIETTVSMDSVVQVSGGLGGNENIAVNGQYLVDSESFIQTDHEK